MMRFAADLSCSTFPESLALILHHVAEWAARAGETVTIVRIEDVDPYREPKERPRFAVELTIGEAAAGEVRPAIHYLRRVLPEAYGIETTATGIAVTWNPWRFLPS
jgi:hypothetical protein